ncbi:MAG: hypothetical protein SFU86_00505 [Pirellulaceae bacterium]|nr:hypothetical protein [Pirellulaceae bacterium]
MDSLGLPNRRLFVGAFGASLFTTPGLFAEQRMLPTPRLTGLAPLAERG